MAIDGPSGSGKTYTSLLIAQELGERFALIDTEHGTASKYAGDVANFDTVQLESFSPETYVKAIEAARDAGYPVLVIDSLSHAWDGVEGALEQVDKVAKRSTSGNSFTAWRDVTPMHRRLVEAILAYPGHVIATMRVKTEYVMETDSRGKTVPKKIGLAPVQRAGIEYEFDVVGDIDHEHDMVISKSRCSKVAEVGVYKKPGKKFAHELLAWLEDGAERVAQPTSPNGEPSPKDWLMGMLKTKAERDAFASACDATGVTPTFAAREAMADGIDSVAALMEYVKDKNPPKETAEVEA